MTRSLDVDAAILVATVPDEYSKAIGGVIIQWGLMESILDAAIWRTARVRNDIGRTVSAQLMVQGKLDLLGAILMQTKPALGKRFAAVASYVRECLMGGRNTAAHGMWFFLPGTQGGGVVKFAAKGRLVDQGGYINADELNTLAFKIAEVTAWLMAFCEKLPPLRQRRGGLGHKPRETPHPQGCATRRMRALQHPSARWIENPDQKSPKKRKKPAPQKKRGAA